MAWCSRTRSAARAWCGEGRRASPSSWRSLALAIWLGLIVGVALGGGGIAVGHSRRSRCSSRFFGFAIGAVALAARRRHRPQGARRRAAAAAFAILGWLINGFAPLVGASSGSSTCRCSTTTRATTRSPRGSISAISRCSAWFDRPDGGGNGEVPAKRSTGLID